MRILFWTNGFWPRTGGIETLGLQLLASMQEKGHQCLVLANKDYPHSKEDEIYRDITIKRFDFNASITRELKTMHLIKEYVEWIAREFQPDVIYLNALSGASPFVFLLFRKLFSSPVVITVHDLSYEKMPPMIEKIYSAAHHICCVSKWTLDVAEKFLPSQRDKLRLIYNGLSMPAISPTPLPFVPPTILLLGRLSWEKGFDTAIEAFSLLKKRGSNAQLLIAGDGPERRKLEELVGTLELTQSVQFTGAVPIEDVPSLINRATFVVCSSFFEAFGLVALEAMQMERPVIASAVGGLQEIIQDGETGILVPSKDTRALCEAMQVLLSQPELAIEMGIKGRKRAMENFTLSEYLRRYEELFEKCCLTEIQV